MKLNRLAGAVVLALAAQGAQASGFGLIEQSASGQGLSYAGAAANTEDASVMWFNPAGLTDIEGNQAIAAGHILLPVFDFTNDGSNLNGMLPLSGDDSNAGVNSFIPNLYWKGSYKDYDLGFALNVPFGSKIEYDTDWAGGYQALDTNLKTVNLNFAVSKELSDGVSLGVGLNAQYAHLQMTQDVDGNPLDAVVAEAEVDADSWGYGYNLGLMIQATEATKLGVSYRSEIKHEAKGDIEVPGVGTFDVTSDVTLPASAMLSVAHDLNSKTVILADATWTGWSAYDELVLESPVYAAIGGSKGTDQQFGDSMRYSLGMTYQLDDKWKLRTGVARDLTPVPDAAHRSPRTPDSDRTWLSFGANYKLKSGLALDVGYTHIFFDSVSIARSETLLSGATHNLNGEYEGSIDILSAQLVWNY